MYVSKRNLRNLWMSCFWISNDHSSTDYADDADDKKQEPTLKRKTTKVISTWGKRGTTEVVSTWEPFNLRLRARSGTRQTTSLPHQSPEPLDSLTRSHKTHRARVLHRRAQAQHDLPATAA